MIVFYGSPMSSAGRTHWMLEEVGVAYRYVPTSPRDGATRTPEFLDKNPAGTIPFIEDSELRLFESIAINFYLAEKYAPALLPSGQAERALAHQWSLWAITNVQPLGLELMMQAMLPETDRDAEKRERARAGSARHIAVLERSLTHDHLLGNFSVADVNAGSVINLLLRVDPTLTSPKVGAWMDRLRARPAYQRAAKG